MAAHITFNASAPSGRLWSIGAHSTAVPVTVRDIDGTRYIVRLGIRKTKDGIATINPADHVLSFVNLVESIDESGAIPVRLTDLADVAADHFEAQTGHELTVELFTPDGAPVQGTVSGSMGDPF